MHSDYDHLILGGGPTADAAATAIRSAGDTGTIAILTDEEHGPFPRPPLSKYLWLDESTTVANQDPETSEKTGATVHLSDPVTDVDTSAKQVTTASGDTYGYGRLLIATGAHPNTLEDLPAGDRVLYYRTRADYERLAAIIDAADSPADLHVAVVGGGYIGTEMAAAMQQQGCRVSLLHPGRLVADHMFPAEIAQTLTDRLIQAGVDVRNGVEIAGGTPSGDGVTLRSKSGEELTADVAVVGLGVSPSTGFLHGVVDLTEDGGVEVDGHLATSASDVYAAGDVASYPDAVLGRTRVSHIDNADQQGAAAGRILAGSDETYDYTPMFWSDVFDLGYEAVGTLDASLDTYVESESGTDEDGNDRSAKVVYYADQDGVRGVLLWRGAGDIEKAKELIKKGSRPADLSELAGSLA
ncbi:NAD(P)/FAD-dependent oxidoreductase [Nocardioidaceae bacterium]|nr:NAD(P)/FAD-dependent oxidoreductase [Nocardioidaceae bacterium]